MRGSPSGAVCSVRSCGFANRLRFAPSDYTRLEAFPCEPLQRDPILRVKTLGFEDIAVGAWNIVDQAIGEHAVHIHKQ